MEIYKDIQFWVIQNIPFMSGENATIKSNIFIIVVAIIIGYVIFRNSDDQKPNRNKSEYKKEDIFLNSVYLYIYYLWI